LDYEDESDSAGIGNGWGGRCLKNCLRLSSTDCNVWIWGRLPVRLAPVTSNVPIKPPNMAQEASPTGKDLAEQYFSQNGLDEYLNELTPRACEKASSTSTSNSVDSAFLPPCIGYEGFGKSISSSYNSCVRFKICSLLHYSRGHTKETNCATRAS
jgi:hypothetical protein